MIRYIYGVDWKLVFILVLLSIFFALGISLMMFYSHDTATEHMQSDIQVLQKRMDCPNNECDRFKGKDAKALEARLMAEIAEVKKDCGR
jgi:hypothetical protein